MNGRFCWLYERLFSPGTALGAACRIHIKNQLFAVRIDKSTRCWVCAVHYTYVPMTNHFWSAQGIRDMPPGTRHDFVSISSIYNRSPPPPPPLDSPSPPAVPKTRPPPPRHAQNPMSVPSQCSHTSTHGSSHSFGAEVEPAFSACPPTPVCRLALHRALFAIAGAGRKGCADPLSDALTAQGVPGSSILPASFTCWSHPWTSGPVLPGGKQTNSPPRQCTTLHNPLLSYAAAAPPNPSAPPTTLGTPPHPCKTLHNRSTARHPPPTTILPPPPTTLQHPSHPQPLAPLHTLHNVSQPSATLGSPRLPFKTLRNPPQLSPVAKKTTFPTSPRLHQAHALSC